ncbi:MAG: circularly permuted type 2 ATP-grasp protein [Lachnospiraceae bacterium]|nr:circularly permuted type 2 ATP-grasp protein [Lachnospiraceae bacterium]
MRLQEEVFETYKEQVNAHMEENREGALKAKEALENSPLNFKGVMDKTIHIPKVFDSETIDHFKKIASFTHGIFSKVIKEYRENADFRKLFPFSKELEELILLPIPYDALLPIMRMDLFYHEDTGEFKFCEINTDGTAAMIRDLEMRKVLNYNPAHNYVSERYELEPFELFDSWVKTFMSLYETYPKKRENPNVALVDFLENATYTEFEEFERHFKAAGINCEICEIRSLKYEDGVLYSEKGNRIDAIYRRVVTADIMDHYDEVGALLDAVRDDSVFIAGSFATQVIHTKWLFYVLHHEMTEKFLTEEELAFVKKHIPLTLEFSSEYISMEEVISNKDKYILKPMDAYASKGIYAAGREHGTAEWEKIAKDLYGKGYICQEYCEQYMKDNIDFGWGDGKWHKFINMPGLYTYNGEFKGILMRTTCEENIITAHDNERTMPVFLVKGKK